MADVSLKKVIISLKMGMQIQKQTLKSELFLHYVPIWV